MKRILIFSCLLAITAIAVPAQVTSRSAFNTAPASVLPSLPKSVRLDMIDYFESGSSRPSGNMLDAPSRIVAMDGKKMELELGNDATVDICVLQAGKKEIIMVITSVFTPAADSSVRFYDSQWKELNHDKLFKQPSIDRWTGKLSAQDRLDFENLLPFMMTKATFDPEEGLLTLVPTIGDYLPEKDLEKVKPMVKEKIVYRWNGKKFIELK